MRAYSTDLREKIVMAYESGGGTLDEMASASEVDRRTVSRLLHRYRAGGGLVPKPHGGGYPASLDDKCLGLLRRQVEQQPDATLEELAAYLKKGGRVEVHPSTVCRALQRLGLPRKKKVWRPRSGPKPTAEHSAAGSRGWTAAASSLPTRPAFI